AQRLTEGRSLPGLSGPLARRRGPAQAAANTLTLVGSHGVPALGHAVRDAVGDLSPDVRSGVTAASKPAEQDAAEDEQAERLPEGHLGKAEERRKEAVPELAHDEAAQAGEQRYSQDRQRSQEEQLVFPYHVSSSSARESVVDALQPLAQVQHRVALAREQRVHPDAGLGGHVLARAALELVGHEDRALVLGQLVDRELQLLEQDLPRVERVRSGLGRRQDVLESERRAILVRPGGIVQAHGPLPAEEVRDAIAR